MKIVKIFKKWRIIILILFIIFAVVTINPKFDTTGVVIKGVEVNSSASKADILNPRANIMPTQYEVILTINDKQIRDMQDYAKAISDVKTDGVLRIKTNQQEYALLKTSDDIGLTVAPRPSSNIRKGLELQGGTRVLLQPAEKISDAERVDLISTMENRLNVYGLTDIKIKPADDLLGNKYISVEVAGATKEDVKDLIAKQGKFEAKIGDETVFSGGKRDVVFVCRNDATCSGVQECNEVSGGYSCKFEFAITLSQDAAKRQAAATANLDINETENYLSKDLDLYLDNKLVDSLKIAADLKGKETTQIAISGPGIGVSQEDALQNALKNMNKLQTILITGSLPTSLNIVKMDTISATLGEAFVRSVFLVAILAIITISIILFIRYRNIKVSLAIIISTASEVLIVLGILTLFRYNLDLPAIAALIASIGTGVDDLIVITEEIFVKESYFSWKDRIKRAFFIIMSAYAATVAAMLPLLRAGAGLLTGFAIVTIAGVSIGVFISRPAFAAILEILMEE